MRKKIIFFTILKILGQLFKQYFSVCNKFELSSLGKRYSRFAESDKKRNIQYFYGFCQNEHKKINKDQPVHSVDLPVLAVSNSAEDSANSFEEIIGLTSNILSDFKIMHRIKEQPANK